MQQHIPAQVFDIDDTNQHPGTDERTHDAQSVKSGSRKNRIGIVDQPHRNEADTDIRSDETGHAERT